MRRAGMVAAGLVAAGMVAAGWMGVAAQTVAGQAGAGGAGAGQAGRRALDAYLDGIAAKDEAARAAEVAKIATRDEAVVRQQELRVKLRDLMGGGFERTPLNAKVLGSTRMDGFRIEKVLFESQPGFYVTALLYVPEKVTNAAADPTHARRPRRNGAPSVVTRPKWPAIVMAPGHSPGGKAGDYGLASTFARNGFVVLSYDPIGQGERIEYLDRRDLAKMQKGDPYPGVSLATRPTGEHGEAGLGPTLIGDAVARYFAWDGMRAVDYLVSRPEVDAERIGAFGCSGGGAMTALLGAADRRVKAIATACYLTTMDALLPAIGPQDAEQSIPGFIAGGFDFADWVELAAPRAYAMVGTTGDMFPWAGFVATAREARRFYGLFDAAAEGENAASDDGRKAPAVGAGRAVPGSFGSGGDAASAQDDGLPTVTGPVLNPDTANAVGEDSPFQVIAGVGGHGNLKPLTSQIVGFFLVHLAGRKAEEFVGGPEPTSQSRDVGHPRDGGKTGQEVGAGRAVSGSFDSGRGATSAQDDGAVRVPPAGALQVTATGQVATSYPGSETVHSLTLKRAKEKLPQLPVQTLLQVQTDVREVTAAEAVASGAGPLREFQVGAKRANLYLPQAEAMPEQTLGTVDLPSTVGKHSAVLVLTHATYTNQDESRTIQGNANETVTIPFHGNRDQVASLLAGNNIVVSFEPRPSPPGGEETKATILGPFYLTELRAELVGKTLLGMRVDDVIRAVDYLAARPDVDAKNITVVASGHMGLVALHAAVLDPRIKHVTVDHVLQSYRSLLEAPMPVDAPQDILPGVLEKYDVPDLVRVLGPRVTATEWVGR